jgi:hypothetical protein
MQFDKNNPPAAVRELSLHAKDLGQTIERIARRALRRAVQHGDHTEAEIDEADAAELTTALNRCPSWAVTECRVQQPELANIQPDEILNYAKVCSATSTAYTAGIIAGAWIMLEAEERAGKESKHQLAQLMQSILVGSAFEMAGRALRVRALSEDAATEAAMEAAQRAVEQSKDELWVYEAMQEQEKGGAQ